MTTQPKFGEWIKCSEGLPDEDLDVLVFGKELGDAPKVWGIRRRHQGDQDWKYTWEASGCAVRYEDDVTHWMPLPEPPNE